MTKVFQFPTKAVRSRVSFDNAVRTLLCQVQAEHPSLDVEQISRRMLSFYDASNQEDAVSLAFTLELPERYVGEVEAVCLETARRVSRKHQEFWWKMMLERLLLEVHLAGSGVEPPEFFEAAEALMKEFAPVPEPEGPAD